MIAGAHAVLWSRLDAPGNDACRFAEAEGGFIIEGNALSGDGTALHYRVRADATGATRRARLRLPDGPTTLRRSAEGQWTAGGEEVAGLGAALDLDLGFTPATLSLPIRRLALSPGEEAEILTAWLDPADWRLKPRRQIWMRVGAATWTLRLPDTGEALRLTATPTGIVTDVPGRWMTLDRTTPAA